MAENQHELCLEAEATNEWFLSYYPELYGTPGTILMDTPEVEEKVAEIGRLFTDACKLDPDGVAKAILNPETISHLLTAFAWLDLQRRIVVIIHLETWRGGAGKEILDAMINADFDESVKFDERAETVIDTIRILKRADAIKRMTDPVRMDALIAAAGRHIKIPEILS